MDLVIRIFFDKLQFELKQKISKMDNEYNRYYIKIRTILGINLKTIHEELATALGSKSPSYPTVAECAKHFREGRENVNDHPRSARLLSELADENIELVPEVISNDPSTFNLWWYYSWDISVSWYNNSTTNDCFYKMIFSGPKTEEFMMSFSKILSLIFSSGNHYISKIMTFRKVWSEAFVVEKSEFEIGFSIL